MKRFSCLIAISAALILPAAVYADITSLNENFDELTAGLGVTSLGSLQAILGTNVDIVGPSNSYGFLCAGPESGNCVDMGGSGGIPTGIVSSSAFANGYYLLSFDLVGNGRPENSPGGDTTTVTLGDYTHTFSLSPSDVTSGIVTNQLVHVVSPNSFLKFTEASGGNPNVGNLLDNVSVSATTPEPGFYGLLALGLSGLVTVVGRRKKSSKA